MAFYTKIRKKNFKKIEKKIGKKIIKIKGISEGTVNSNYIITTKKKKYILTILEKKKENILETIKIVNFINKKIKVVPKYYKINKKYFFFIKKKKTIISEYKKGKKIKKPNKKISFEMGKKLSLIHKEGSKIIILKKNKFNYNKITKKTKKIKKYLKNKKYFFIKKILRMNINFLNSKKYEKLTESFCHCDLFLDNVLFTKNKISAILDFHFSCFEKTLYDISIYINEWCFYKKKIIYKNLKYFLFGYFKNKKIKNKDFKYIYNFMLITSFRFLITRLETKFIKKKPAKKYNRYFNMINYYLKNKKKIIKMIKKINEYTNK